MEISVGLRLKPEQAARLFNYSVELYRLVFINDTELRYSRFVSNKHVSGIGLNKINLIGKTIIGTKKS